MIDIGQTVRGVVEKLVFGGKGLIRHQGWVIFVADVVAGEEVDVAITQKKKSYFEATLVSVVVPSASRVVPPCPYFGSCGGCQLQHLAYSEQLKVKKEWLMDALERQAKIPIDFPVTAVAAKKEWGYRRKVILHGEQCGFFARDNTTIIPIERCLLFSTKGFDDVRSIVQKHTQHPNRITVMRNDADDRAIMIDDSKKILGKADLCERTIEGLRIFFSPAVFVQNDPDQALQIYKDVLDSMQPGPIVDLYCGVGVMSLLAAKRGHKVLGVELDSKAIELAKLSAKENGLNTVEFLAKPCEKLTKKELHGQGFEQWIVNPPRIGLSNKVIETIISHRPQRLVYISCMPSTLARDCKVLYEKGYALKKAQVYDMFAETTHLESVVYFEARAN